jgi:hypothetical protein
VVGYAMLEPRWTRTSPAIAWLAPLMAVMISVVVIGALL